MARNNSAKSLRAIVLSGSGGRIRTYDLVINSHPLCQLSYAGIKSAGFTLLRRIFSRNAKMYGRSRPA